MLFADLRPLLLLALLAPLAGCPATPDDKPDPDDSGDPVDTAPVLTLDDPVGDGPDAVILSGFVADDIDAPDALEVIVEDGTVASYLTVNPDGTFSKRLGVDAGTTVFTVTATDSAGNSTTATVAYTVGEGNAPPTAPVVHIEPVDAVSFEDLTVAIDAEAADPEGEPLTLTYAWTLDGAPYGDSPSVGAFGVFRGQVWEVQVRAKDGAQDGPAGTASITIGNAPPLADSVTIGPAEATVDTPLTCTVTGATDIEGDALAVGYAWTVDGAPAGEGAEVLSAGLALPGQDIVCAVTLDDSYDTVTYTSATFQIGNSAPGAPTIALTPEAPTDTDDLSCLFDTDTVDPDGDVLTFTRSWARDGVDIGFSEETIAAADTHRGEVWTCTVTATDPGGLATSASASVTIDIAWRGEVAASDAPLTIDGAEAGGAFGKSIALVGDMDGDSLSELLVGANGENGGDGAVYLFAGSSLAGTSDGALTTADAIASWDGAWTDGQLGGFRSLAAPGDLDGDGAADLLFAAADADANGLGSGITYLVHGGGTPGMGADPSGADWQVTATAADQVGARLAAGDLDGDGFTDLLVAAPGASDSGRTTGTVGWFAGTGERRSGTSTLASADWSITGDAEGDGLGWTTRFVGDVDGDGYEDAVLGAMYADTEGASDGGSEAGAAGLVLGGAVGTGSTTLADASVTRFSGAAAGDRFGYDVLGGVDLDEDGVDDLLVAAYQDDTGGADAGSVYAFLGGPSWATALEPVDADLTIAGSTAGARFGHVMATPGDLDGDGTRDLLIGALFDSPTGLALQGAAYLLLAPDASSAARDSDIAWRASGEAASDYFGDALSSGEGDLDGDGRSDFAVGAQGVDGEASATGRVYLWTGR